ncbi:WD40 repeat-like protein [Pilatotrama ljubarskyi]|nr:WD40 repeat-like protein [Pilatotrama ljubarskyi]
MHRSKVSPYDLASDAGSILSGGRRSGVDTRALPRSQPRIITLQGHVPKYLEFTSDGEFLASGGEDGRILIWDTSRNTAVYEWPLVGTNTEGTASNENTVPAFLAFSPDAKYLACVSESGKLTIWDISSLALNSASGPHLGNCGGGTLCRSLRKVEPLGQTTCDHCLTWLSDNHTFAVSLKGSIYIGNNNTICQKLSKKPTLVTRKWGLPMVAYLLCSLDGRWIAAGGDSASGNGLHVIHTLAAEEQDIRLIGTPGKILRPEFHAQTKRILVPSADGDLLNGRVRVAVHDIISGNGADKPINFLIPLELQDHDFGCHMEAGPIVEHSNTLKEGFTDRVSRPVRGFAACFSPNGNNIATIGCRPNTVQFWSSRHDQRLLKTIEYATEGERAHIVNLKFSPGGQTLFVAVASEDKVHIVALSNPLAEVDVDKM